MTRAGGRARPSAVAAPKNMAFRAHQKTGSGEKPPQNERDTRAEAEAVLGRYPNGARVQVHYDPDDPQSSVLQMAGGWALHAIMAALFALTTPFGIMITVVMSR